MCWVVILCARSSGQKEEDAIEAPGVEGSFRIGEEGGAVGEGECLEGGPGLSGEIGGGLDEDGHIGGAGDIEAKLVIGHGELRRRRDQWTPRHEVVAIEERVSGPPGCPRKIVKCGGIVLKGGAIVGEELAVRSVAEEIDVAQAAAIGEDALTHERDAGGNSDVG